MNLALGNVASCPLNADSVWTLKNCIIEDLEQVGFGLSLDPLDRTDMPTDCRLLGLLLRAAEDPDVGLGNFSRGVRVGPGARMPRLPALYKPMKKWRLADQADPWTSLKAIKMETPHGAQFILQSEIWQTR